VEARANYVAVGAFVLVVLAGILVGTLWLARTQFKTEYQYLETHVAGPVSGLGTGAAVRLNGIEVGRVTKIDLDPMDPKLVTLLLQVRDTITIHADSVASIETQGLTGVGYVEISGGTINSPKLTTAPGERYPVIASRPSSLQEVFNDAPQLLARLLVIGDRPSPRRSSTFVTRPACLSIAARISTNSSSMPVRPCTIWQTRAQC
jgi:phospholipid/cholesterol/gamma-HCH transport system substrate-binding protein